MPRFVGQCVSIRTAVEDVDLQKLIQRAGTEAGSSGTVKRQNQKYYQRFVF